MCLLASTALAQTEQTYIRNKPQPNFFIPDGALAGTKPERVSIPQYRQGRTTAKRISARASDNQPAITTTIPQMTKPENTSVEDFADTANTNAEEEISNQPTNSQSADTNTPNYQQMYQNYLKDLNSIAAQGKVTDPQINEDLKSMSSEARIQIDKQFNQQRNVRQDINDALQ